jgi:hypothetical protein
MPVEEQTESYHRSVRISTCLAAWDQRIYLIDIPPQLPRPPQASQRFLLGGPDQANPKHRLLASLVEGGISDL